MFSPTGLPAADKENDKEYINSDREAQTNQPGPNKRPYNDEIAPPPTPTADAGMGVALAAVGAMAAITVIGLQKHNNSGAAVNGGNPSDIRLKRDIHLLATLDGGMKIYSFKYLWSDTAYVGVMAQDLLANPAWRDAVVTSSNGFYAVKYGALGLKMVTLEEWQAQGLASIKGGERMSALKRPQALQPAL